MDPRAIPLSMATPNFAGQVIAVERNEAEHVKCQACSTANACGFCDGCNKFLCLNCHDIHTKFGPFSTHKLTKLEEIATAGTMPPGNKVSNMNCPKHDDPLRVFCETCQELICRDCTISIHKNHEYDLVSNCYNRHRQMLDGALADIEKKKNDVRLKIAALTGREDEIREQEGIVKEEVHLLAEEIIDAIRQSEKVLMGKVEFAAHSKLQVTTSQKMSAEFSVRNLEECSEYVKQSLDTDTQQQALSSKKQTMERINRAVEEINEEDYNPIEKCDVQLIKKRYLEPDCIGDISYTGGIQHCKVKNVSSHQITRENDSFSFPLSIELPVVSSTAFLTVPLSSLSCSVISTTPINTTVTTTDHPGVYRIHCTPAIRGRHQVSVKVDGIELESVSLLVPFNPHFDTITPICTIAKGLNGPFGVAISIDGHFVITECGSHCVTILDKNGTKIKSFINIGGVKFSYPRGVAITPDNFILVADNNKVQKISMDGELIQSVGKEGSQPLEFDCPFGIAISPAGLIYIVDSFNHRIQVLNADLTFSFSFGRQGSSEGEFLYPHFIAIDNRGTVYVTDYSARVQKFTADGKFISQFTTSAGPEGIEVVKHLVYVTESGNHRVAVYSTDGKFISFVGSKGINEYQLNRPHGITFGIGGFFICDNGNNKLVMY